MPTEKTKLERKVDLLVEMLITAAEHGSVNGRLLALKWRVAQQEIDDVEQPE